MLKYVKEMKKVSTQGRKDMKKKVPLADQKEPKFKPFTKAWEWDELCDHEVDCQAPKS
jgi:hypothetical protein